MTTPVLNIDSLKKLGITSPASIEHNTSFDVLFAIEQSPETSPAERGQLTELNTINVNTGKFTGRSPKDKYVVKQGDSQHHVWWSEGGSDNQPITPDTWKAINTICVDQLNGKKLYVMDGFCGANPETRLSVRLITEIAWQAHFFKNMFVRPTDAELAAFKPDWTILNACKTSAKNFAELGLRSETFVAFNIEERMTLIGGTWYGGEIKKGIFSIMNYFLPLKGIGSFHCSANMSKAGNAALFFGLSGTGKTTLSTDPHRALIGDDEHGWDDQGIFNFEGGCYAKTIRLSREKEPEIYDAIRKNALLENVVVDVNGKIDFDSAALTENTRVSYPIEHIDHIVRPISKGGHPDRIIFLTCDAYGVLPPVSTLSIDQAMVQYLSGYTAKVAGTELDVKEPMAVFSACFGQPFLMVHPTRYSEILGRKMRSHNAKAYLVNTGWCGGDFKTGSRISLKATRAIIDAIFSGDVDRAEKETLPIFQFEIPKVLPNVDSSILNPANAWGNTEAWTTAATQLASKFVTNFQKFTNSEEGKRLAAFGPQV